MTTLITSNSILYGSGVFTTVAIYGRKPTLWEKHWKRLANNSLKLDIDLSEYSVEKVRALLDATILENEIEEGRARMTFFDERLSPMWSSESAETTRLAIITGEKRLIVEPFRLAISPFPVNSRSPLAGVKSSNYLEQILSLDEAKGRGFHEAVRVNERGHVTSGCMSNIFWLKNDRLYTSTLATGCLAGTTREHVLENIECEEVEAEIGDLESADAIYLTSAGLGIVRVAEFDGRQLPDTRHPIQTLWPPS